MMAMRAPNEQLLGIRKLWVPFWECLLYWPVVVFPIALLIAPALEHSIGIGKWCASAIESKHASAIVMLTVGLWCMAEPLIQGLWHMFAGVSGSVQIERIGRTLMANIVKQHPVDDEIAKLHPWVQEWNVDWAHFEARLWYWLAVRYAANDEAERAVKSSLLEYVAMFYRNGHSDGFANPYLAWQLRTEARLRALPNTRCLVPPQLPLPEFQRI